MTTTNNLLTHIRSLAPNKMTDDELGFELLRLVGREVIFVERFNMIEFHGTISEANCCRYDPEDDDEWGEEAVLAKMRDGSDAQWHFGSVNPVLSYDALLPIVREWATTEERGFALERTGLFKFMPIGGDPMNPDMALFANVEVQPRQLAEAFVAAARKVEGV